MKTFEIYFNDLNERAQKELMELVGLEKPEDGNWTYLPLATVDFEDEKDC